MRRVRSVVATFLACSLCASAWAAQTQTLYLSGKGKDDAVQWDFMCNAGMKANQWSTIKVPSNWELQGFGIYTYGRDQFPASAGGRPKVQGRYKRSFTPPADWAGKKVFIVFEGAMTDTQVSINGQSAGPMHQGGFYRFKYDITSLLRTGQENLLEVTVDDESANASVNNAERRGDYWNLGGIYRPVYLEAVPADSIDRVAIDAKADGTLTADVTIDGPDRLQTARIAWTMEAQLLDMNGQAVGAAFSQPFAVNSQAARVATKVASPRLWTAETPNLYQLELRLKDQGGAVVHTVRQRFGFRSVEVRPPGADGSPGGVFVNGRRILFKGVNRHTFWPDSGRTTSEALSRADIELMKDMNMNAVRMSHYPPDQHFLDICDELGLYVLDEIAGWHQRYDTPTGRRIIEQTVTRDVNHPCILLWDNGNEGGWNTALDDEFARWDPQKRLVLHPWELFRGIDTKHYPQYSLLVEKAAGPNPFFPTEMLHALYDGGAGAGLEDYWRVLTASKVAAGGFIWAFSDECVVRTDQGGKLDPKGNQAPDGIVGPYREKEGSFFAVKELWSPIVVRPDSQNPPLFTVENRYSFTDAEQCSYQWEWRRFNRPGEPGAGYLVTLSGSARLQGPVAPGQTGRLQLQMPTLEETPPHDALAVIVKDPAGRELWTHVWPVAMGNFITASMPRPVAATQTPEAYSVTAGDLALRFDRRTGLLAAASRDGKNFSLINGPRLLSGIPVASGARGRGAQPQAVPAPDTLASFERRTDGDDVVLSAAFNAPDAANAMRSVTYRIRPDGWLQIDYSYAASGPRDFLGVGFDYPRTQVQGMRFLGNGPYPVWKNRLSGGTLNVWEKKVNSTAVGYPVPLAPGERFDYPPFGGFYQGVRWMQFQTTEGPITALINQEDLFVQALKPSLPPANLQMNTVVPVPPADIAFLHAIVPIGSKFDRAHLSGPQGQPTQATGEYKGSISLYFGELPG